MADPNPMPDPQTPEWLIAYAAKEVPRRASRPEV